jgi:phosphoglycerate dehydrogenase-like enzyme
MSSGPLNIVILVNAPAAMQREYREGIMFAARGIEVSVITDLDEIDPYLPSMDVLMTYGAFLRDRADEVFQKSPRLRWIQGLGSGVDNLLPKPGYRDDIIVSRIRGIHGGAVSEAAIAVMLCFSRDIPRSIRNQQAHLWERRPSRPLEKKTAGLLGVGLIAVALARRLKAFDMKVVGITSRNEALPDFDEIRSRGNLATTVRDLDFLIVLAPYTKDTHHLVDAGILSAMKPTSYLINLARGGVVDEAALLEALTSNKIAGAALDVFATEPLPQDHPFWDMPNVLVTPHTAGMNVEYVNRALPLIIENIRHFEAGDYERMQGVVRAGPSHNHALTSGRMNSATSAN